MNDRNPPRIANGFFGSGGKGSDDAARVQRERRTRPTEQPKRTSSTQRKATSPKRAVKQRASTKKAAVPTSRAQTPHGHKDQSSRKKTQHVPKARMKVPSGGAHLHRRYFGLGALFCLLLATTVGKLTDLQVVNPSRYRDAGIEQRTVHVALPAARGALLDRNGGDIAVSVPRSSVVADPTQVKSVANEANTLAPVLNLPESQLKKLLSTKSRFVYLARLVSDRDANKITSLVNKGELAGISLIPEYERVRPNGTEAQSLVGMTDIDGNGISGLESQYNNLLLGKPGEVTYERSALGPIAGGQLSSKASLPGNDLQLSIDLPLQYTTEQLVAKAVKDTGSESGIAIVSRPSTGEILAMVNEVSDPKTHKVGPSTNNEAVTTVFEPGSVNKVVTVAAALEEHKVTPATVLAHPSTLTLGGATFGEAESLPSQMSVTDILTVSSNIGTIELAQKVGAKVVDRSIRDFGFGKKSALNFPNESPGLLLPLSQWSGSSIGSIPIGQGISVTALQMLQAYSTIANNGVAVPPRLVTATVDTDGVRHPIPASPGHRVISADVARQMRGMLANVVRTGTGMKAAVPGYQVAGKTGTARKPLDKHQPGNGYLDLQGNYHYVSTFVGMLPANDPQLSIIVVLNDPEGSKSYFASDTSAPLFGAIARAAVVRLRIPPSLAVDVTEGLPAVNPKLLNAAIDER